MLRFMGPVGAEPVEPAFYQLSGKIRVIATCLLLGLNLVVSGTLDFDAAGIDPEVWTQLMLINTPLLALGIGLGALIWRGTMAVPRMRQLTIVCVFAECMSTLLMIRFAGSVTSHMIVFSALLVLIYRAYFDYVVGCVTLAILLFGLWGVVLLEVAGVTAPASMFSGPPSPIYFDSGSHISAMVTVSVAMLLAFIATNTLVAKLRSKEAAIKILRANLAAAQPGRVGRYTMRTLNDTYVLGNLIGKGGMGEVYRGHHRRTRRPLAIKTLHAHLVDDEKLLKRFQREAEITGSLGSPHIVKIVDVGRDAELPYIVLELLDGDSLGDLIERTGPLPLDQAQSILVQAATGLEIAHEGGITHRDLKPENLFLARSGEGVVVKLLDFGISKIHADVTVLTQDVALMGTPCFMSPEQARGVAEDLDARTDIFALGAIAYTIVTGRRPFAADSLPALLKRICDEEPVPISELRPKVPPEVASVIAIAMAKEVTERYATARELREDLVAAFGGSLTSQVAERARSLSIGEVTRTGSLSAREGICHDDTVRPPKATGQTGEQDGDTMAVEPESPQGTGQSSLALGATAAVESYARGGPTKTAEDNPGADSGLDETLRPPKAIDRAVEQHGDTVALKPGALHGTGQNSLA